MVLAGSAECRHLCFDAWLPANRGVPLLPLARPVCLSQLAPPHYDSAFPPSLNRCAPVTALSGPASRDPRMGFRPRQLGALLGLVHSVLRLKITGTQVPKRGLAVIKGSSGTRRERRAYPMTVSGVLAPCATRAGVSTFYAGILGVRRPWLVSRER